MSEMPKPDTKVEVVSKLSRGDLSDLCHAAEDAIEVGGWEATYVVELSSGKYRMNAEADAMPQANLAELNRGSSVVDLSWRVPHQLRIEITPEAAPCHYRVVTRLYRNETELKTLLERSFTAECGE